MTSKVNKSTEPQGEGEGEGDGGEHPTPLESEPAVQPQGNVEVEQPKAGDEAGQQSTTRSTPVSLYLRILNFFFGYLRI